MFQRRRQCIANFSSIEMKLTRGMLYVLFVIHVVDGRYLQNREAMEVITNNKGGETNWWLEKKWKMGSNLYYIYDNADSVVEMIQVASLCLPPIGAAITFMGGDLVYGWNFQKFPAAVLSYIYIYI